MRDRIWKWIRWFLFRLDPERAHRLTVFMIRTLGPTPLRILSGSGSSSVSLLPVVFGLRFRSRVGLAAGFDKDAEIVAALPALGFGFAEIGTVTPLPQPGNPRPRLFRDPERRSLFNCMGFNGGGANEVSTRLERARARLPEDFRVGVNLGKNKSTPLEDAASDYRKAAERFDGLADYLVINVSSPNTPGLRSLQTVDALKPIVEAVNGVTSRWRTRPPLLLKLAPELTGSDLASLLGECEKWAIDGWVLTNTLGGSHAGLTGGWSGELLREKSQLSLIEALKTARKPVISVGGVMSVEEAQARRRAGAELVQLYTGWIYGGPSFPASVALALAGEGSPKNKKPRTEVQGS